MLLKRSFILIALCLLVISHVHAQQDASSPAANENAEEELQKEALEKVEAEKIKAEQNKTVSKAKPPEEVFKPTEEISEDSPVPFPVDI